MPSPRKTAIPHPYKRFEGTGLWRAVEKGVRDLVENQDLKELARREYIVGYLCEVLTKRRHALYSKPAAPRRGS
jgi:hypothetical protein